MMTKQFSGIRGQFIHPVCEKSTIAGQNSVVSQHKHKEQ